MSTTNQTDDKDQDQYPTKSIKTDPIEFDVQWRHIEYIDSLKTSDEYPDDWSSVLAQILDEHGAREEGY